jgi:hypothetical protein
VRSPACEAAYATLQPIAFRQPRSPSQARPFAWLRRRARRPQRRGLPATTSFTLERSCAHNADTYKHNLILGARNISGGLQDQSRIDVDTFSTPKCLFIYSCSAGAGGNMGPAMVSGSSKACLPGLPRLPQARLNHERFVYFLEPRVVRATYFARTALNRPASSTKRAWPASRNTSV